MANQLSPAVIAQIFSQESDDPFLTLVTLSSASFDPIRLVNNTEDVLSRGNTFISFPMRITFPTDDGETVRTFKIEFDNVSLDLITQIRGVTDPIDVQVEMILASMPDDVQILQADLLVQNITYTPSKITATIVVDNFLNTEVTSERYSPDNFIGLF